MLSIENSPVPDPPCPYEISQLKSIDERASSDELALQEVDLLKSDLDDTPPLPNFSIRDYVFSARSKDIKKNWPFSQKNLQLCLNHGLPDLLPPFHSPDSVRNQSTKRCTVENSSIDKENKCISNGELSKPSHNLALDDAGCSQKLGVDCAHMTSNGSDGDEEIQLKTTSQSHSEFYSSVPTNRIPCLEQETDTLLEEALEAKLEAAVPSASHETESSIRPPIKKCRLIFKLSSVANPSSKGEDSTPNSSIVSETMTSKVCPVCKVFSSPSNTTLNAHIDQCLSGESNAKWTANCNVINKHRIKTRKTRLMVDIYATAKHCTLEDLDKRNGTSWATNSSFPAQEIELCAEEREQRDAPVNFEDIGNTSGVYIDANGTKVRILSKFSDVSPASKVGDNLGPSEPLEGCNISKFFSNKKKKGHSRKHHKFMKLASQSKAFSSPKHRYNYQVRCGQERDFAAKDRGGKDGRQTQCFRAQEQIEVNERGTIRQWVGSKRSGLMKNTGSKADHQRSRHNATHHLPVESHQSPLADSYRDRLICIRKTPKIRISYENPISSPLNKKEMEMSSYEPQVDEYGDQRPPIKKIGFSSMGSRVGGGKRSLVLSKQDGTSKYDACNGHRNKTEKHTSSPSNKDVEMNPGPPKSSDSSVINSKLSWSHRDFSLEGRKFTSMRNNSLSVNRTSVAETISINFKRKCLIPKTSRVHSMSALYKDAGSSQSQENQPPDLIQNDTEKQSLGKTRDMKIRKKGVAVNISREETMDLKSSPLALQQNGHDVDETIDSSVRLSNALDTFDDVELVRREVQTDGMDIAPEPTARMALGGSFMSLNKSLHPKFNELASTSDVQYNSLRGIEVYKASFYGSEPPISPNEASFGGGQGMFCSDEMETALDSKDDQGNYLPEVDPILIPGPPGSYLPSPGDTDSDDLEGNSSLTSSMVQSSEENHNLFDRDSSESPISATSTVSRSVAARSDSKSSDLSVVPYAVENWLGFSAGSVDPMVEPVNLGVEKINSDDLRANAIFIEEGPPALKNDRSCCCSRKEAASQGFALNYQDSQLHRRRTIDSASMAAAISKQMSCDPSSRHNSLNSMSELFSLSSYPSPGTEKVTYIPAMKSPAGHVPMKVSSDSEVKFPNGGDCDSASTPVSNSVLRLMGKNLMVANKDDDASPKLGQAESRTMDDHPKPQSCTLSGVSPGNVQNEDCLSVTHAVSRGPIVFSQNQHHTVLQPFDVLSNSSKGHVGFKTPQTTPHASEVVFSNQNVARGNFTVSSKGKEYKVGSNLPTEQNRPLSRLDPLAYNLEKIVATPAAQHRNSYSPSNPVKEIIIIDDTPESEAGLASAAKFNAGMVKGWGSSAGISIPLASEHNSRRVNTFYGYQPQLSSPYGGPLAVQYAGFQMSSSRGANAGSVRWNCTPEGTDILHPSSLTASSSSTCHKKSTFYYSPSLP